MTVSVSEAGSGCGGEKADIRLSSWQLLLTIPTAHCLPVSGFRFHFRVVWPDGPGRAAEQLRLLAAVSVQLASLSV